MLGNLDIDAVGKIADFLGDREIGRLSQANHHLNRAVKKANGQAKVKKYFPYLMVTQPLAYEEDVEALCARETDAFVERFGAEVLDTYVDRTEHMLGDEHSRALLLAAMAGDFAFLANNPDLTQAERELLNVVAVSNNRFGEQNVVYNQLNVAQKTRAFEMAAENGNAQAVKEILRNDKKRIPIENRCDALQKASSLGHLNVVEEIFSGGGGTRADNNQLKRTATFALHKAARKGHLYVLKYFFKKGVVLYPEDPYYNRSYFEQEVNTTFYYASRERHREVIRLLLSHGARFSDVFKRVDYFALAHRTFINDAIGGGLLALITRNTYALGLIPSIPLVNFLGDNFRHQAYSDYTDKTKAQTDELHPERVQAFQEGQLAAKSNVDYFLSWTPLRANSLKHPKAFAAGYVAQSEKDTQLIHRIKYPKKK